MTTQAADAEDGASRTHRFGDWADGAAFMDGAYMPIGEAKISVLDWGLIHADAVYDVAHVWDGAFFRLEDHLDRFEASMAAVFMSPKETRDEMRDALHGCVARAGLDAAYVAMVCTRGRVAVAGSRDPRDCENRFFAYAIPFIWVFSPEQVKAGATLWISKNTRRIPADSVDPIAKNYHWGDFTRALFEAKRAGYDNALLLDHQGCVTEGPGFNIFAVFGRRIETPRSGALLGVTRRTVMELAAEAGYEVAETDITAQRLIEADEVFVSTTGGGVRPIARVDETRYAAGAAGAVASELAARYWRAHASAAEGGGGRGWRTPVRYELAKADAMMEIGEGEA